MRWSHPTEGIIRPQLLIPWAEANGDIVALGEWVLTEGCRQAASWPFSVQRRSTVRWCNCAAEWPPRPCPPPSRWRPL